VNQGGEPAHDDYGLPRVDVQVPDDASELDRDVQAYHRELRALRRHERSLRWRAPLRHSGMIVPLIAGCLVLAMVAGMVLTMFSANPYFGNVSPQQGQMTTKSAKTGQSARGSINSPSASSAAPSARRNASGGPSAAAHLPPGTIKVDGRRVDLKTLVTAVMAIIPANCRCGGLIRRLVSQAVAAGVGVYLVGSKGSAAESRQLAAEVKRAHLVIDLDNVLTSYASQNLSVVLVDSHRNVASHPLRPNFDLEPTLKGLQPSR
jgi:flagellar basal body-associated protein FliL